MGRKKAKQNNIYGVKLEGSGTPGELSPAMAYHILGLTIRSAIIDWADYNRNKGDDEYERKNHNPINTARHFLFSDEGLELWIERFDIKLNIEMVRDYANKAKRGFGNGCLESFDRLSVLRTEIEKVK